MNFSLYKGPKTKTKSKDKAQKLTTQDRNWGY